MRAKSPSLHRHYPASSLIRASPPPHTAWPGPRGSPVEGHAPSPLGLPVLRSISMYIHADATTPAGSGGCTVASSPLDGGLPRNTAGSAPAIWSFEACSAFTHVSACMFAESPKAIRFIRGFDGFVTSSSAPTATGWNDPSPGGNCTHWKSPPLHGAQYFHLTPSFRNA